MQREAPKTALITGTSTGIGRDAARYLLQKGWQVFGSVRREEDGRALQTAFDSERFTPLLFDVTDEDAIRRAAAQMEDALDGRPLHGLVNNAGIAVAGPLEHLPLDDLRRQLEINVVGQMAVTQAFLPFLKRGPGRIVNISSVSGKRVYPFFGPYAASKHALEALSDALRRELMRHNVDVIVIEPGSVKTPIWEKAEDDDIVSEYAHTQYGRALAKLTDQIQKTAANGMDVAVVSKTIYTALTADRPRSRYPLPNGWLTGWYLPRLLPDRWVDRLLARALGLRD